MTTSGTETISESSTLPSPKKWRRALPWGIQLTVLLVVFIAGGVAGAMMTTKVIHSKMEEYRLRSPIFSEDIVMRLRIRLGLSDEQARQVQGIVEQRHSLMIEYRNEGSRKVHAEFDVMVKEVARVLDDVQAQRWHDIADHVRRTYLPATASQD